MGRRHSERGTTLLLFPVGLLIVLLLGALAIDSAMVFHAQRQATRAASLAAEDAAGVIDDELYRSSQQVALDEPRALDVAAASLRTAKLPGELVGDPRITVDAEAGIVTVEISVRVRRSWMTPISEGRGPDVVTVVSHGRLDLAP